MNLSGNRNDLSRRLLPQNVTSNTAINITGSSNVPVPFGAETDPIFSAWDRKTGILINVAQLIDSALLVFHTDLPTISINTTGTLIANNLSGNNTGDQDLTGLVPYFGATQNVDLGIRTITGLKFFATTLPIALNELTTKQYVDNMVLGGGGGGPWQPQLNGIGYVKANGVSISYDNTTFEPANANIQLHISNLSNPHATTYSQVGAQVAKSPLELYVDATEKSYWNGKQDALGFTPENVLNKGQNNGYAGLDSGGKVPMANLPSALLKYKGVWDATTNTPTLTNNDITKAGFVYNVSVPGTQFAINWGLGDWLIYNDLGVIEKSDNSDDVTSVNTQTGAVVLGYADVGAAAAAHVHGNITSVGAIGATSNLPLITTTGGVITTGSFGTAANTFAEGNDGRFTDARTPLNHALIDSVGHFVSGLTAGHFLKALSPTTYGFAAHGITPADIGAVPYTGATADLNLGAFNFINTGYLSTQNFNVSNHYTGFEERVSSTLTFVPGAGGVTRTLTLTCAGTFIWINGVRYSCPTLSRQITADITAMYWFWITAPGGIPQLNHSTTPPGFGACLVATVYWNTVIDRGIVGDERHWMGRDKWMHEYLHETIGARYAFGLAGVFTSSTFSFTSGEIYDEDIEIEFLGTTTNGKVLYKNGSSDWEWDEPNTTGYKVNGTRLRWNNGNVLADVSNGDYMAMWFYATNNTTYPINIVMGQRVDGSIANARLNNTPDALLLGALPAAEMKLLYRVIYRQVNATTIAFQEAADYRTIQGTSGGAPVLTDHSSLSNLAYGTSGHVGFEADLGLPALNGYVLSSTTLGVRSWIAPPSSMVYPGVGIALSTGSGWDTSITNNSANWNTAFGWGNHAGLYSLLAHLHTGTYEPVLGNPLVNGQALVSTIGGVRSWASLPAPMVYPAVGLAKSTGSAWDTSVTDNSSNWNTAFGWGNHAGLYALLIHSQPESSITFTDILTGNASISAHGYLPKLGGGTSNFLRADGTWAAPSSGVTPAALSKVDDTNVTLTLGGTPLTALLQAVTITAGWTGTLADARIASAATWNAKQAAITGGATTITTSNLTASRALVSDASGKVAVATTTAAEIGFVNGVTSAIQTQLNAKTDKTKTISAKAALYTVVAGDADTILECNGTFTVTLPNGMATGMRLDIINVGVGVITLAASTTLNSKSSNKKLASQWIGASVYHRGSNVWVAIGDLTA